MSLRLLAHCRVGFRLLTLAPPAGDTALRTLLLTAGVRKVRVAAGLQELSTLTTPCMTSWMWLVSNSQAKVRGNGDLKQIASEEAG